VRSVAVTRRTPLERALGQALLVVVCGVLPLLALWYAIAPVASGDRHAVDVHFAFLPSAEAVLDGEDLYPTDGFIIRGPSEFVIDYVYPPLLAVSLTPWTILPDRAAEVLFQAALVLSLLATLFVLGVRDWRCYGLAFLWPPVTDAVTTGNISLLIGLTAALAWRYRDEPAAAGAAVGISIATKIFLWPLTIWLAATRRVSAAAWSVGIAVVALVASWAVVGFRGMTEYPDLVRRLGERMDERAYTVYALGVDLGLSPALSRVLWAALAVGLLVGVLVLARRGEDRRSFVLALAAAIALSPIVWLHYFSLLIVAVAIVQPRLGVLWFLGLPLQVIVTTGVYNGSTFQTAAVLAVAALTIGLALREPAPSARVGVRLSSPAAAAR
jgi:hypothetical protein